MSEPGDDDDTDRPHEASPKKLDEARKKGDIPRMTDLTATAGTAGFLMLALLPGGWVPMRLGDLGLLLLDRAEAFGPALLGGGTALGGSVLGATLTATAPALLIPGALALALLVAFRGLVFAPEKLMPKLSRIGPISNAKQKFGATGLVEFAKSALKLVVFSALLWWFLLDRLPRMMATTGQSPGMIGAELMAMTVEFLGMIVLVMLVVGGLDQIWQILDHRKRQRMTDREMRDEHKDAEGDPHLRQARRQKAMSLATRQMVAQVPRAAVVIVNPTHYAVALAWSPEARGAPVCVAKGTDEIAARIREAATAAGVPIHSDPPTARALHAATEVGAEIAPDHYAAVAAAIRFADAMRARARAARGR